MPAIIKPHRQLVLAYGSFAVVAFLVNFLWENAHAGLYQWTEMMQRSLWHLAWMSVKDVLWYLLIVLFVALPQRRWLWFSGPASVRLVGAIIFGFLIAGGTELHALTTNRWGYLPTMPLLLGLDLGLSPLLQMSLGLWLTISIVKIMNKIYRCPVCGLAYADKKWARECEQWCRANNSCNTDIIKHALPPQN